MLEGNFFFFSLGDVSVNGPFGVTENVFVCYHGGGGAVAPPPLNSETIERKRKEKELVLVKLKGSNEIFCKFHVKE